MILIPKPQKCSKENKIADQSLVGTQMLKSPIKNMQTKSKIQCSSYSIFLLNILSIFQNHFLQKFLKISISYRSRKIISKIIPNKKNLFELLSPFQDVLQNHNNKSSWYQYIHRSVDNEIEQKTQTQAHKAIDAIFLLRS